METLSHEGKATPVDKHRLADLVDEITTYLLNYMEFPCPELATLVAYWIVNTYTYTLFRYCGYLALRSALPGSGKSRLLRVIGLLSKGKPPITCTPTASVVYRSKRDVWLIDEVDRLRNADREQYGQLIAILNVGFEKGAIIERSGPKSKGFAPEKFEVYGPKALAGIEAVADTLADRAFQIQMKRASTKRPRLNERKLGDGPDIIRKNIETWVERRREDIERAYDALPDEHPMLAGFDDRFQDISEPLIVHATLADEERPEGPSSLSTLIEGLKAVAKRRESAVRGWIPEAFLEIVARCLDTKERVFIPSAMLHEMCTTTEELSRLKTTKALARFLKPFDLRPTEGPDGRCRGYWLSRDWLDDMRGPKRV